MPAAFKVLSENQERVVGGGFHHNPAGYLEQRVEDLADMLRGGFAGGWMDDPVNQAGNVDGGQDSLGGEVAGGRVHAVTARQVKGVS